MQKILFLALMTLFICSASHAQILKSLGEKVKWKSGQRANNKVDNAIDKGLDKAEDASKSDGNNNNHSGSENNNNKDNSGSNSPGLRAYQNYDFVPGDKILFEDHFTEDRDGELPTHWELKNGQGILNKIKGEEAFFLTDGNYAKVLPRMKIAKYLTDPSTLEFDMYGTPGVFGIVIQLGFYDKKQGFDRQSEIILKPNEVSFGGVSGDISLSKKLPSEISSDNQNFDNKWHHVAIAFKNHQVKIYVDQFRVLVVPDTKEENYDNVTFAGIGDEKAPIVFKNVRIASGGDMNMIGKKFTEAKIVTHGINFDIDKATIKPESMGTLNMIAQVMKDNPEIKFEIDGHTDNSGAAAHNLTLSQQRANAVKDQLVKMGIESSRLNAKGFGDTKPISDNTSLEGKANNRRVEFVKL